MVRRAIRTLAMALSLAVGSAGASSIGVFFGAGATDCDAQVAENSSFTIYLIALLGGDAAGAGVTGTEYRLAGFDPAWTMTVTPNPSANLTLGSPVALQRRCRADHVDAGQTAVRPI